MTEEEHYCGYDGDYYMCIDGEVYGPCPSVLCSGVCEPCGRCGCECHPPPRTAIEIREGSSR